MRGRISLLVVSLLLNAVLAIAVAVYARKSPPPPQAAVTVAPDSETHERQSEIAPQVSIVVSNQSFNWNQLESSNYVSYIANLRGISCPEQTIRDIIIADVDQFFANKRVSLTKSEDGNADMQWWKQEPQASNIDWETERALQAERIALLNNLLGTGWYAERNSGYGGEYWDWRNGGMRVGGQDQSLHFDGPALRALSAETKKKIEDIRKRQTAQSLEARAKLQAGLSREDYKIFWKEEETRKREARADITAMLTSEQFEEYELRNSTIASQLRSQIPEDFNISPEEFRKLYRGKTAIEASLEGLNYDQLPDGEVLEERQKAAMQTALGEKRYAELVKSQDSDYQHARSQMEEYEASPQLLEMLYEINKLATAENERLDANTNLTDLQREIETKKVELEQLQAQARLLGQATRKPQ